MAMKLDEIQELIRGVEGERSRLRSLSKSNVAMWELDYWSEDDRHAAEQEGRELVTAQDPRNIVGLATRLIANVPTVTCPVTNIGSMAAADARDRERFLRTLWQVQGNSQDIDPLSACIFNMLVRSRAAIKVLWVKDKLPKSLQYTVPPIKFMALNPEDVGIMYGDLYPTFAFHKIAQKARVIEQQFESARLFDNRKRKQYDPNEIVTVYDVWYTEDDGTVWQTVLLDQSEFLVKPRETKYVKLPIIERKNDPVPLEGEHRSSQSILNPLREQWGIRNQLLSMHFTAVGTHLWPVDNVVNDNGESVQPLETGMGAFNQLPAGTRFLERNARPDIQLLQSLEADLDNQQIQASFAPELYGRAPDTRTAGYSLGMSLEAASGRVSKTVFQLERLLIEANELALCAVEHFSGSKGVTIYGYSAADRQMFQASLGKEQIEGMYVNNVSLSSKQPMDKMQMAALGLQFVQAKVLSKRTVREEMVPIDVPEDEELQIEAERVADDPDLLAAIVREAAAFQGIMLPPGEPDWQRTPQQPPQMPPQQQVGVQQPQMPVPQAPDMMGAITPESMGQPQMAPQDFDMMMGQQVSPEAMLMQQLQQMGMAAPDDMRPRP